MDAKPWDDKRDVDDCFVEKTGVDAEAKELNGVVDKVSGDPLCPVNTSS